MDEEDLTPEEIKSHLATLGTVTALLARIPLDRLFRAYAHYDSIGPILDPTGWSQDLKVRQQNQDIMRAADPLWHKARELEEMFR